MRSLTGDTHPDHDSICTFRRENKELMESAFQRETGHKPRGKAPTAPKQEPGPKEQYNFTDPESRIMKTGGVFQQCYNAQAAVEVQSRLTVGG